MRPFFLPLLCAALLAGCGDPVLEQARVDTRHDAVRADTMLAVDFRPGTGQLDQGQAGELRTMVAAGQRAQRDEFMVVTDGSGGPIQTARAEHVRQSLSAAGARWVGITIEPAMTMGPDQVVVVRSEYRIAAHGCPSYSPAGQWNPNESQKPGFGCADAYNMGQMLARPRDAAVGSPAGPADGTVSASAVQRYREGRVRTAVASSVGSGSTGVGGDSGGGAPPPSSGSPPPSTN
jgi:type IV pilus biogenesis protein CpaD/CtpE